MRAPYHTAGRASVVAGAVGLLGVCIASEVNVSVLELPDTVKATMEQHANGATPTEIELETENGKQIYSVEFKIDGKEREIEIAPDGKFLGEEIEDDAAGENDDADDGDDDDQQEVVVDPSKAPELVTKALATLLNGSKIKELSKETEDGNVVYEAEYDVDGQEHSATVSEAGKILETEKPVVATSLPTAVTNSIKVKYPAGNIQKSEEVTENPGPKAKSYYELKVVEKGKTHEVEIDRSGKILKVEDDD